MAGITKVQANLQDQLVFVEGTTAPSQIVSAIEATGRDAILRGSGKSNSTSTNTSFLRFMLNLLQALQYAY